jgi:hypothetical protein
MGVRTLKKAGLTAAAALAFGALTASAQVVTYSTTGTFSGGTGSTTCAGDGSSCSVGGFTLSFINAGTASYLAPSFTLVDMGQFQTAFSPTGGTAGLTAFTGVSFTLQITQSAPSAGTGSFSGTISGSLAYNPSSSSLVWTPTTSNLSIGSAQYVLVLDQSGNENIQAPTAPSGNPNLTSVKANVLATPEPATALLLAPGLAGMGLAARFRRRNSSK